MTIMFNSNIPALKSKRNLAINTTALNQSLQRLSSGFRINSSKDDAAGLQISNKLTSQIHGNAQAIQNAQDGMSLLGVAENVYNQYVQGFQRIRELAVQYANDTNGISQRCHSGRGESDTRKTCTNSG